MLSFGKGEIIFTDHPYATVVTTNQLHDTCNWCFAVRCLEPIRCSTCLKATYCSEKHRAKDSAYHKYECLVLRRSLEDTYGIKRFTLRTLVRVLEDRKSSSPSVGYFFEHRRTFDDLVSHADVQDDTLINFLLEISDDVRQLLSEHGLEISEDIIMDVMLKLYVNVHSVMTIYLVEDCLLGHAVYLAASKLNHTCEGMNEYVQLFDGNRILYKALMDFSVRDSLELKTHYIPIDSPLHKRREALEKYCFTCECKRCLEESKLPQFTILPHLEAFTDKPPTPEWRNMARNLLKNLTLLPTTNYYKQKLMKQLFRDPTGHESIEDYFFFGTCLLECCVDSFQRLNTLLILCHHLVQSGASAPSHELYDKLKYYREQTQALYTDVYGETPSLEQRLEFMNDISQRDKENY